MDSSKNGKIPFKKFSRLSVNIIQVLVEHASENYRFCMILIRYVLYEIVYYDILLYFYIIWNDNIKYPLYCICLYEITHVYRFMNLIIIFIAVCIFTLYEIIIENDFYDPT